LQSTKLEVNFLGLPMADAHEGPQRVNLCRSLRSVSSSHTDSRIRREESLRRKQRPTLLVLGPGLKIRVIFIGQASAASAFGREWTDRNRQKLPIIGQP
jgi:hypothetical protein